ncbi:MAG: S-layer homology domain-containing protein, partial [Clostridia bacterium]
MGKIFINFKKKVALVTIICMMFTQVPANVFAATSSDISGHWAQATIQKWVDQGIIKGYADGTFRPENNISRAEFMTLVNGIFGYTEKVATTYSDVSADDWYADVVTKAAAAGYINGYPDGTMRPDKPITREEAATIIMKINKLMENEEAASKFTDASTLAWSKGAVGSVYFSGIMNGYPNGSFQPRNFIKRGEAVFALDKSLIFSKNNVIYDQAGTYGPATGELQVSGNVIVQVKGTVLQNMVISGNLIIDKNVGDGNVTLKNVTIKGETKIYGGGLNSIIVINSDLGSVTVAKVDGKIRMVISGNTTVDKLIVNSGATIEESNMTIGSEGFQEIIVDAEEEDIIIFIGFFTDVKIDSPGIGIELPKNTNIENLTINGKIDIAGEGIIKNAIINASGVTLEKAPTNMVVAPGVTAPVIITPVSGSGGSVTIEVIQVSAITVTGTGSAITVVNGETLQMIGEVAPTNATNKTIAWSVINGTGTATIDANGLLTATGVGTVTVQATNAASSVNGTKVINVTATEIVLVAEFTNAENAATVAALLNASPNALGLDLTNYAELDAAGKSDVAADLFAAKAELTTKALIQTAVGTAIATAKVESEARAAEAVLVAQYTNAADAAAVTTLLATSPNALGLTLANYAELDATGKSDVAADLFAARAGLTTKALIQTAVETAIATAKGESEARATEAAKVETATLAVEAYEAA